MLGSSPMAGAADPCDTLVEQLFSNVLSWVSTWELLTSAAAVSKAWQKAARCVDAVVIDDKIYDMKMVLFDEDGGGIEIVEKFFHQIRDLRIHDNGRLVPKQLKALASTHGRHFQSIAILDTNVAEESDPLDFVGTVFRTVRSRLNRLPLSIRQRSSRKRVMTALDVIVGSVAGPKLRRLQVTGHVFLSAGSTRSFIDNLGPHLTELRLGGFRTLKDKDIDLCVKSCPNLRQLHLHECSMLNGITLESKMLESVSLARCMSLKNIDLKMPKLWSLDLSFCRRLQLDKIQALLQSAPLLSHLNLTGCNCLSFFRISSPHLEVLNVSSCLSLVDLEIDCPELAILDVGLSYKLRALHCKSQRLQTLDLGMLTALEDIELHTPQLTDICARGLNIPKQMFEKGILKNCPLLST